MQIDGGGFDRAVTKQPFDHIKVNAGRQQMRGETMAQGVDAATGGYSGFFLAS